MDLKTAATIVEIVKKNNQSSPEVVALAVLVDELLKQITILSACLNAHLSMSDAAPRTTVVSQVVM